MCHAFPSASLSGRRAIPKATPITLTTSVADWWCHASDFGGDPAIHDDLARLFPGGNSMLLSKSVSPPTLNTGRWSSCDRFQAASSQYYFRADEAALRAGDADVTWGVWAFLTNKSAIQRPIFCKGGDNGSGYYLTYLQSVDRFFWQFENGVNRWQVSVPGSPILNTWYLLIAWYDHVRQRIGLRVNATEQIAVGAVPFATAPGGQFQIGHGEIAGIPYFDGRLEQLTRWNRLLTNAEKAALLTASLLDMDSGPFYLAGAGTQPSGYAMPAAVPAAPSDLAYSTDGGGNPVLIWLSNSPNAIDFEIHRQVDGGAFSSLTIVRDASTYTDTTATPATHVYGYKVRALNFGGQSAFSTTVSSPALATIVDVLLRMDTANANGTTPSNAELTAATLGAALGTWSKVGADNIWVSDTAEDAVIAGLALSGGSGAGDATTKSFRRSLASNGGVSAYPLFTFGASKASVSIGFAFKLKGAVDEFDIYNLIRFDTGGGNFLSFSIEIDGGTNPDTLKVQAHAGAADGAQITGLALDTWYWATLKLDNTTSGRLRIYSLPGLVQQGAESVATRGGTDACTAIRCGMTDPTGATAAGSTLYWDDIAFDTADDGTGPVYPLLPT